MSQKDRIIELLKDGQPHKVDEVLDYAYGSVRYSAANLTGRISELRRKGYIIDCSPDKDNKAISWYRLLGKRETPQMAAWSRTKLIPLAPIQLPPAFKVAPKETKNQTLGI